MLAYRLAHSHRMCHQLASPKVLQHLMAVLIAVTPLATHAQRVATGDRIRVVLRSDTSRAFIGALEELSTDSLVLRHSGGMRVILATPSIATVAVSAGRSKGPEEFGAVIGFVLGFVDSYAMFNHDGVDQSGPLGMGTMLVNVCMGLVGAGLGMTIGHAMAPELWSTIRLR